MDDPLLAILRSLRRGELDVEEAWRRVRELKAVNLGFAEVDLLREARKGFPEVVFCLHKQDEEILAIARAIASRSRVALLTRARPSTAGLIRGTFPEARYFERSGAIRIGQPPAGTGLVTVISAGTSDIPVAEEAAVTAETMGARVRTFWDIGVAGLHRLISKLEDLQDSRVIVAVAGMDGALPTVTAGVVSCPVIAVPTSVGYGTGAGGYAALLTMLNSCAPGVAAVNVDNGFGAGYVAALVNRPASP